MTSVSYCVSLSRARPLMAHLFQDCRPFPLSSPQSSSVLRSVGRRRASHKQLFTATCLCKFPRPPASFRRSLAPLRARILALVIPPRSERELWRLRACLVVFTSLFHLTAPKLKHSPRGPSDGRNGGLAPSSLPSIDISQWRSRALHFLKNVGHVRGRPGSATMGDIFASYS